ncbi:hypothetical protein K3758_05385 [Sulfitobacter sp. W002]|uniref:hypothetical protein n=1 Tax=Sulfitobacter sp. W002 TaxID=2867024 RepID=UPI0021A27BFE|nr:hypothetical protein [Sulfitobacter sp. W002]UWR30963.1 hypothetical protein K3758_05385 [Sulfitobacter sp. W002]
MRDVEGLIAAQVIEDVQSLTRRVIEEGTINRSVGFSHTPISGSNTGAIDFAELMLFTAGTASLIEYALTDGQWRLEVIEPGSADASMLTAAFHHLRASLMRRSDEIRKTFRSGRVAPYSKRALAILVLSLDAAKHHSEACMIQAGVSLFSNDPVGDAQLLTEEWDLSNGLEPIITPINRV